MDGSPIATVTTIFKPLFHKKGRFVSLQTAYDSSATVCQPSYNYQLGSSQAGLISSIEFVVIQAYLLAGYIVASPDYEGPDAAFPAGRLEGMGVLDNMRAVGSFKKTLGFSTSTPMIVGIGYSGGALATGWAASLQPTYAPELTMKGWIQGGTASNLTRNIEFMDSSLYSGLLLPAINGLAKPSAYGAQLGPLLESIVTPRGREALDFANAHCAVADVLAFPELSVLSTSFQSLGPDLLHHPDIAAVLQQLNMGVNKNETPTAPVLMYHGVNDQSVFTSFANGGHFSTEIIAIVDAVHFVADAFAGKVPGGCSQNTELSSTLNPIALGASLEPLLFQLLHMLATTGKNDENISKDLKTLGKQ